MATHESNGAFPAAQFEVSVHWSDQQPAVVARLDRSQTSDLVARLAEAAPGEVGSTGLGPRASAASLLLGIQAFYRLTFQSDSTLSLADVEYHGRVQSLLMFSFSGFGLAALPLGLIADAVGLRETMVGMGLFIVVFMIGAERWRRRLAPTELPTV